MNQPTAYRIEFGPAWPVPPITVDFADRTRAARTVAEHAIPYLTPKLTEMGRPEFADCFFHTNTELTAGQFMWLDLPSGRGARFCPARLTPAAAAVPAVPTTTKDGDTAPSGEPVRAPGDHTEISVRGWTA